MPTTVKRTILGPGRLTLDPQGSLTQEMSHQVRSVELVPSVKTSDPVKVLDGQVVAGQRTETWALKGKILPDFGGGHRPPSPTPRHTQSFGPPAT